jgi:hypothetical protein
MKPESDLHLKHGGQNVCSSAGFTENPNEVKHGFAVRNVKAVVAKYLRGIELEISENGN